MFCLNLNRARTSRDGGIDVVAFDTRPLIGGKVVIQAKRYRNTVGASSVQDLFGTMAHEGANKGILVSPSGYGPEACDFIKGKPIELIDGGGLLGKGPYRVPSRDRTGEQMKLGILYFVLLILVPGAMFFVGVAYGIGPELTGALTAVYAGLVLLRVWEMREARQQQVRDRQEDEKRRYCERPILGFGLG